MHEGANLPSQPRTLRKVAERVNGVGIARHSDLPYDPQAGAPSEAVRGQYHDAADEARKQVAPRGTQTANRKEPFR